MKRKVVALTGKIGSGKSTVATILRDMGYKTVDCDALAKQVADESEVVSQVRTLLGDKSVVDGKLNRRYIRETVFSDEALLGQYQEIFFAGVRSLLLEKLNSLHGTVFVEIALPNAFEFAWDEIWRVESSEQNCISRVTARDGVSEESAKATLGRQKEYRCSRVIVNNGNIEQLRQSVAEAVKGL